MNLADIFLFGIIAICMTSACARALDNVGRYQLNAVYACAFDFTEVEHNARCRNELDGYGHMVILPAPPTIGA